MTKNYFTTPRGNKGLALKALEEAKNIPPGTSFSAEGLANLALDRYDTRIRAKLKKLGLHVPDDGPFTVQTISDNIKAHTGLELDSLTKEGIMQAVDGALSREFSEKFGVTITSVFNPETLRSEVKAALLVKIQDGTAYGFVKGPVLRKLREIAALRRAGKSADDGKKLRNAAYQKKYRRTHKLVWD